MSNNDAYIVNIKPNGSSEEEDGAVHQTSPAWVLTFVRWDNRDTLRIASSDFSKVREALVVENDCVSLNVGTNKGTLTPSMNATLKETDVNYMTDVAPGDFVFVNILNWESDARDVAKRANHGQPINGPKDGFKGVFKVQSVRKIISSEPDSGKKTVSYKIDGFAFTEFNNTIYFNQNLLASGDEANFSLFASNLSIDWADVVNLKGSVNVQDILAILIQCFIGSGISTQTYTDDLQKALPTANTHFYIPGLVGSLLGITGAKAAKDVYSYLFGIQSYSSGSSQTLAKGLNPNLKSSKFGPGFHYTTTPCAGDSLFKPEFWNASKAWSILSQYLNAPLNEVYTCFRLDTSNKVVPTVVFRQIPFTTPDFSDRTGSEVEVTEFLNLPRWAIDSALVFSADIGRDEVARVNFVQYYSRTGLEDGGAGPALETAAHNYVFDKDDVKRSGLRPSITSNSFDPIVAYSGVSDRDALQVRSPDWAKVVGDALIGGHLKLNGTLECAGIVDPITVGDNVQFDNVVFHIESVIHTCGTAAESGMKQFRTILKLSSGVSLDSESTTKYAEMKDTSAYKDRETSFKRNDKVLPGVSEAQDILSRPDSVEIDTANIKNSPFPQPE